MEMDSDNIMRDEVDKSCKRVIEGWERFGVEEKCNGIIKIVILLHCLLLYKILLKLLKCFLLEMICMDIKYLLLLVWFKYMILVFF